MVNTDGISITAKIPNKLLTESLPIHCYIYLADSEDTTSMKTILHIVFIINKRQKPDDYHYEDDSEVITLRDRVAQLETYSHTIVAGFIPMFDNTSGLNWTIYQWADGSTTFDRIKQNPDLAGTEIIIGTSVYKYSNAIIDENGVIPFQCGHLEFQHFVDGTENGTVNERGHFLPCGYTASKEKGAEKFNSLVLYDEEENIIQSDSDGDLEQCAILYDPNYGVKGFKINGNAQKVYLSDFVVKCGTEQTQSSGTVLSNLSCTASGIGSISAGGGCNANGSFSVASGASCVVDCGYSFATGAGIHIYTSAGNSASFGGGNSLFSPYSFAVGNNCTTGVSSANSSANQAYYSIAMGNFCQSSGTGSISVGERCQATKQTSIAAGSDCIASANYAISIGAGNQAVEQGAVTIGMGCYANSPNSISIGNGNRANAEHSVSIGYGCQTIGEESVAFGTSLTAVQDNQFVIGKYNSADTTNEYGFIMGNGASGEPSNAIAIDWQGKIYVNGSSTGVDVLDLLNRVKALEEALDGLKLKKTTTSEYNSLSEKDTNTVYLCTDN